MSKYRIDFEYKQFGDVTLDATDDEHAEDLAIEHVSDMHGLAPEDIEIVQVVNLDETIPGYTVNG